MTAFHHPNMSATVLRRRGTEQLLDLLVGGLEMSTQGAQLMWRTCYRSDAAYYSAMRRLEKKGLILRRRTGQLPAVIQLTRTGALRTSEVCRRTEPWPRKWNGIWYLLGYDVPESDRHYRDVLRTFLKRLRMGCLQKSLWVSAKDIRPEYDDLRKTIRVDLHSFLFEAKTVLGRPAHDVVRLAWNWSRLERAHRWYLSTYQTKLTKAQSGLMGGESLCNLLKEEVTAYVTVMQEDPLLPRPLWPSAYEGEKVWRFHRAFSSTVSKLI